MNKKYMDFVPVRPTKKPASKKSAEKKEVPLETDFAPEPEIEIEKNEVILQDDTLSASADTFSLKKEPQYGVIEDFRPKFVKTEVEKRPLSRGHFTVKKTELAEAKSKKVGVKNIAEAVEKPVEKSAKKHVEKPVENSEKIEKSKDDAEDKTKMKVPKSPFINQAKVTKRPLSKNIYERTVKPTEEVATGPVTIISKPEKDTKISLIVTIILTIILGATAGTIAFLLLPK